mmetsp:Transcript_28107/g.84230  ORF Transcript_28107/g.84230 Transcript_28107/m.84230 type:complete len:93 (-) Transcript_28107:107-385(-)
MSSQDAPKPLQRRATNGARRAELRESYRRAEQEAAAKAEAAPAAVPFTSRAPSFRREQLRRDRKAMPESLQRKLTWTQRLFMSPVPAPAPVA